MPYFDDIYPTHNYPISVFNVFPRLEDTPFAPSDPPEETFLTDRMRNELSTITKAQGINQSWDIDVASRPGRSSEEEVNIANALVDWFRPYIGLPVFHGHRILRPSDHESDIVIIPDSDVGILTAVAVNRMTVLPQGDHGDVGGTFTRSIYYSYDLHIDLTILPILPNEDNDELTNPTFDGSTFRTQQRHSDPDFGNYQEYGIFLYTNPGVNGQPALPSDPIIYAGGTTYVTEKRTGNIQVENVNYTRTEGIINIHEAQEVERRRLTVRGVLRGVAYPIGSYVRSVDWQGYRWEVADVEVEGHAFARLTLYRDTDNTDPIASTHVSSGVTLVGT